MSEFSILMAIPDRTQQTGQESDIVTCLGKDIGILTFRQQRPDSNAGTCFTYVINESDDLVHFFLVRTCKETHDKLSFDKVKKYHCIVFDLEEQCFTDTFYSQKKINIKSPIILLVNEMYNKGSDQDVNLISTTILPDKNRNIIQVQKKYRIDKIFETIVRLVQQPEITFIVPESIQVTKTAFSERYGAAFRNLRGQINLKCSSSDDAPVSNNNFIKPSRTHFVVYLIDFNNKSPLGNINHMFQIMNADERYYLVVFYGEEKPDSRQFFQKNISSLENYLDVMSKTTVFPENIRESIISRCKFLLERKDSIREKLKNNSDNITCMIDDIYDHDIIWEISRKMFLNCSYAGIIGGLDEHAAIDRFKEIIPLPKRQKMSNSPTINFHGSIGAVSTGSGDANNHVVTININDYRQQIATIANALASENNEAVDKLKEILNNHDEKSTSSLAKIGDGLQRAIGLAKDTIPSLDFIIKHKHEIMGVIGSILS